MDIIIHSLYTKNEIFIRKIISNASDTLDKVRFISVSDPDYLGNTPEMEIKIDFDFDAKSILFTDTGVGMEKSDLINNLGTIAKSVTCAFVGTSSTKFGLTCYGVLYKSIKGDEVLKKNCPEKLHFYNVEIVFLAKGVASLKLKVVS